MLAGHRASAEEGADPMTIPLWCLLPAVLLPYVWTGFAAGARKQQFGTLDNKLPRLQQAKAEGAAARAQGAHANAFEALAVFAPAVLVAHIAHADPEWSMRLAVAWVVVRVLHGVFYLTDTDKVRSLCFGVGMLCAVGLFVLAGMAP
jgi:uncharacterized MAPEG superfamily protein